MLSGMYSLAAVQQKILKVVRLKYLGSKRDNMTDTFSL